MPRRAHANATKISPVSNGRAARARQPVSTPPAGRREIEPATTTVGSRRHQVSLSRRACRHDGITGGCRRAVRVAGDFRRRSSSLTAITFCRKFQSTASAMILLAGRIFHVSRFAGRPPRLTSHAKSPCLPLPCLLSIGGCHGRRLAVHRRIPARD